MLGFKRSAATSAPALQRISDIIERYNGPKKPEMPEQLTMKQVLPLKVLAAMSISCTRAREMDTVFITGFGPL